MTEEKEVPTELPPVHHLKALPLAIAIDDPYAVGRLTPSEFRLHALRAMLRIDLASAGSLSKAVVLREILDKPLALRRPANL